MVDLRSLIIEPGILALIPQETALQLSVLPLSVDGDTVQVAVPESSEQSLVSDLEFLLGKKVKPVTVPQSDLFEALQRCYGVSRMEPRRSSAAGATEFVSLREEERKVEFAADSSIVSLANRIITEAIETGASDIHVEPHEHVFRIRYRLDGVLHEVLRPPVEKSRPLISRLKIMADLDIAEKRRPQDGRIRVRQGERTIDIRVSTLPTDFGEKVVLRILDKSKLQLDLAKLGFEENDLKAFERTIRLPYGMVLVTGPTGSGKTTTLYAALNSINRPEINITTIEDPIEYNLPGINQTHVRPEIGVTFAAALRSILRQDPNVVMVGEMRDTETAEIAVRAALTGHLVLTTLHTNDAPSAITRLIDMGIEPFLVASSVKMILAQRLLRELCPRCKVPTQPTSEQRQELQLSVMGGTVFYTGKGCPACHNYGYQGRTASYEVLPITNELSDMVARQVTASEIRQKAHEAGMLTLRLAALRKAARGETSLEEVIRETAA